MSESAADGSKYINEKFNGDRTKAINFFQCIKKMANSEGSMQIIYHLCYGVALAGGVPPAGAAFLADAAIDAAFVALTNANKQQARKMYGALMQMLTGDAELVASAMNAGENIGRVFKVLFLQFGGDNFVARRTIIAMMMTQSTDETSADGGLRGHFANKEHQGQVALNNNINMQELISTAAITTMPEPYKTEANKIMARDVAAGVAPAQMYENVKNETIAMQEADEAADNEDAPSAARVRARKTVKKAGGKERNQKKRGKAKVAKARANAELENLRNEKAAMAQAAQMQAAQVAVVGGGMQHMPQVLPQMHQMPIPGAQIAAYGQYPQPQINHNNHGQFYCSHHGQNSTHSTAECRYLNGKNGNKGGKGAGGKGGKKGKGKGKKGSKGNHDW
jgi:hypothetical protein